MPIIKIYITREDKEKPLTVSVTDSAPINKILNSIIAQSGGYLKEHTSLVLKLSGEKTLSDYGIKDGDIVTAIEDIPFVHVEIPD